MILEGHITYKAAFKVNLNIKKEAFEKLTASEKKLLIEGAIDPEKVDYYDAEIHDNLEY